MAGLSYHLFYPPLKSNESGKPDYTRMERNRPPISATPDSGMMHRTDSELEVIVTK